MGLRDFLNKRKEERELKRFELRCKDCGKMVNYKLQAGICPHVKIDEFIFRKKDEAADETKENDD